MGRWKLISYIIFIMLFSSTAAFSVGLNSVLLGAVAILESDECSWSSQDLTTYDEVDTHSQLSKDSTSVTFDAHNNGTGYVREEFTGGEFDADFKYRFKYTKTSTDNWGMHVATGITPNGTDLFTLTGTSDLVFLQSRRSDVSNTFRLYLGENGSLSYDGSVAASLNIPYYITIERDDDGGANSTGLYTATIRTSSHSGSVFDILTRTSSTGEQNNFDFFYAYDLYKNGNAYESAGVIEDIEICE